MSDYHMNGQTLRKLQLNLLELTASTSTPSSEFLVKCSNSGTVFWNSIRIDGFEESFKQNHSRKKQLKECFKFRKLSINYSRCVKANRFSDCSFNSSSLLSFISLKVSSFIFQITEFDNDHLMQMICLRDVY
ncbi:hypothetical protein D917_00741 [Trichinella nativa]|uniref:Uncharacterized protein n=1 Tax=Trichinella nativa TaxID=6335 RepID=A0A1Y3E9H0_9BILA|nr:hypothetical protein D917_00741 [Trichinella nativa]